MKRFVIYILSCLILVCLSLYLGLLFVMPKILNSKTVLKKVERKISSISGFDVDIDTLKFSITPRLNIVLKFGELDVQHNSNKFFEVQGVNINADVFNISDGLISIDYIYLDVLKLQEFLPEKNSESKSGFDFTKLPDIKIGNIFVSYNGVPNVNIYAQNILFDSCAEGIKKIYFNSKVETDLFKYPLTVGENGFILLQDNSIIAKKFDINIGDSSVKLHGILKNPDGENDFRLIGSNLSASEAVRALLFFQKLKNPQKKFIENFRNFNGTIDFDLAVKNKTLSGDISATNLSADTVLFNTPIYFAKPTFKIENNTMTSDAIGTLGGEKARHTLLITDITTPNREVTGGVYAHLTPALVKKYMPSKYKLQNDADIKVVYNIKNKKIDVTYQLNLPVGSDLFYNNAYLGLRDKERQFFVNTYKDGNNLYLKTYDYSTIEENEKHEIIFGDGLFVKENGKMTPKWVTCKTNGYAPVSVTGSFGRYVNGGQFLGDLKYDIEKDIITGNFEVVDTIFNDFYVKSAKVVADEKFFDVYANGKYLKEDFYCKVIAKNDFKDKIRVRKMDLFLDKFKFTLPDKKKNKPHLTTEQKLAKIEQVSSTVREINMDIDDWSIKSNQVKIRKAVIKNVQLVGSLKNSIFKFSMPEIIFANGNLKANGKYSFIDNSAEIDFKANNIDSNIVATSLFDLNGYVHGIANATLKANTYNNLQSIKAFATFDIKNGFLPKLASKEFMANDNKMYKIADYTNVDLTREDVFSSNLKGQFTLDNTKLEDVHLTTQHKALASFLEGDYDYSTYFGDINLYGCFDSLAPKKVRIMHIPLSWILNLAFLKNEKMSNYTDKIKQIPAIEAPENQQRYFKISVSGDLSQNDVNFSMRELK